VQALEMIIIDLPFGSFPMNNIISVSCRLLFAARPATVSMKSMSLEEELRTDDCPLPLLGEKLNLIATWARYVQVLLFDFQRLKNVCLKIAIV